MWSTITKLSGKAAIGASIAAAALGGAHVAGALDVPVLPDVGSVASIDDSSAPNSSAPSSSTSTSTTSVPSASTSTPTTSTSTTSVPSASTPSTSTTTSTSPTAPNAAPDSGVSTHAVLDAGSVTVRVDGIDVTVVSADANAGWTTEIEADEPLEAEVNFRNGGDRVDFRAEIEDGRLRIRVRDRRTDTRTETFADDSGSTSDRSDDDDDDRSGHGGDDDDRDDRDDDDDDDDDDRDDRDDD